MKLHLGDIGNWIRFPETIHELYAHLAQFIGKFENILSKVVSRLFCDMFPDTVDKLPIKFRTSYLQL